MSRCFGQLLGGLLGLGIFAATATAAEPGWTITELLRQGWEIAGYTSTADNRSALILFKKAGEPYLVQCATLYDVLRAQRSVINCYVLK